MTKKDYILIAETLNKARVRIRNLSDPTTREYSMQAWYGLLLDFADQLSLTQRNFDKIKFIDWVLKDGNQV